MLTENVGVGCEYEFPNLVPILPSSSVEQSKTCTKCGEEKPVSEFPRQSVARGRLHSWCRKCKSGYDVIRLRATNGTISGRASRLVRDARRRHQKADWQEEFDLTASWVERQILRGCAKTGQPFELVDDSAAVIGRLSPTIDRINPYRGYVQDNCQVVCAQYNFSKGQWTDGDVLRFAETLLRKQRPDLFIHERPANGLLN